MSHHRYYSFRVYRIHISTVNTHNIHIYSGLTCYPNWNHCFGLEAKATIPNQPTKKKHHLDRFSGSRAVALDFESGEVVP